MISTATRRYRERTRDGLHLGKAMSDYIEGVCKDCGLLLGTPHYSACLIGRAEKAEAELARMREAIIKLLDADVASWSGGDATLLAYEAEWALRELVNHPHSTSGSDAHCKGMRCWLADGSPCQCSCDACESARDRSSDHE